MELVQEKANIWNFLQQINQSRFTLLIGNTSPSMLHSHNSSFHRKLVWLFPWGLEGPGLNRMLKPRLQVGRSWSLFKFGMMVVALSSWMLVWLSKSSNDVKRKAFQIWFAEVAGHSQCVGIYPRISKWKGSIDTKEWRDLRDSKLMSLIANHIDPTMFIIINFNSTPKATHFAQTSRIATIIISSHFHQSSIVSYGLLSLHYPTSRASWKHRYVTLFSVPLEIACTFTPNQACFGHFDHWHVPWWTQSVSKWYSGSQEDSRLVGTVIQVHK